MMPPFRNGMSGGPGMNPFQNMKQMMQQIQTIRNDPSQLGPLLVKQGRITKQDYEQMQQMGIANNPQAMGQYMMNRGMINQQQVQEVYQNAAVPIQNSMNQN